MIGVNFWPEAYHHDKTSEYNKNEEKHRMKQWMDIRSLMFPLAENETVVQRILEAQDFYCFNEVYILLEQLPEKIRLAIPIDRLMWVKNQRDRNALNVGELNLDELSIETLALLKHVLGDLIYVD